jgi:hypothetical protein
MSTYIDLLNTLTTLQEIEEKANTSELDVHLTENPLGFISSLGGHFEQKDIILALLKGTENTSIADQLLQYGNLSNSNLAEIVRYEGTAEVVLKKIWNNKTVLTDTIRIAFASNSKMNVTIIKELAKDDSYLVRCALAENQGTPTDILETLASDNLKIIQDAVRDSLEMRAVLA